MRVLKSISSKWRVRPYMTKANPFWSTPEVEAASRDFNYNDYLMVCWAEEVIPLCLEAYDKVKQAFNIQLEHDLGG